MAEQSKIGWTDHTFNIARGCSKVSEGCKFCYMMRDGDRYKYDSNVVKRTSKATWDKVDKFNPVSKVWPGPALVFTSSLTDVLHEGCDILHAEMVEKIRKNPQLIFQILTKRIERFPQTLSIPFRDIKNVWLGVSVEINDHLSRIDDLLWHTMSHNLIRFISFEPLLGPIDPDDLAMTLMDGAGINWVIIGGESGNDNGKWGYRPCQLEWIEDIIRVCREYNIPVFVKQLGTHLSKQLGVTRHGNMVHEFPKHLQIQEFPEYER